MVKQTAGGGDKNVNTAVNQAILILEADTTDKQSHRKLHMFGVSFKILGNLCGQLACRA